MKQNKTMNTNFYMHKNNITAQTDKSEVYRMMMNPQHPNIYFSEMQNQ